MPETLFPEPLAHGTRGTISRAFLTQSIGAISWFSDLDLLEFFSCFLSFPQEREVCQSVISKSLTLRDTNIRDFGVKFYFSKFRMEPVMLSFLATTENTK